MSVATSTAIGLGIAGAGLAGGVASSALGANASENAASTQAGAANYAANLQAQEAQNALNFQEQQFQTGQQNLAPWLQSGAGALGQLDYELGISPQAPSQFSSAQPIAQNAAQQPLQTYNGNPATLTQANPNQIGQPGAVNSRGINIGTRPTSEAANVVSPGGVQSVAQPAVGTQNAGRSTLAGLTPNAQPGSTLQPAVNPASSGIDPTTGFQTGASNGYGSLLQGWNQEFQAPTAAQAAQTPGYQFELQQGEQALQNSAAAKGGLLSGNTLTGLDQYANNLASTNYQQTYNNALNQYQTAYNQFQNNQANQYNRLAGLAGTGQTAAGQLNSAGQSAANNVAGISQTAGQQIGQSAQNAGAATASGYIGAANAINGGIGSAVGSTQQGILLSQLLGNNSGPSATNNAAYNDNTYFA